MYYANTLAEFTKKLGVTERIENPAGVPTKEHIAWMVEQIASFDTRSIEDAIKAGRWIGWMLCAAEMHGFWSNRRSRELIRMDREAGLHRPSLSKTV
jgi:hypothetical protein